MTGLPPRGMPAKVLHAMRSRPERVWTVDDVASLVEVNHKRVSNLMMALIRNGHVAKNREDGRLVYRLAPQPQEPTPEDFHAKLHIDGDLDLYGLLELEDGGHRITAENLQRLRRMIAWSPAT